MPVPTRAEPVKQHLHEELLISGLLEGGKKGIKTKNNSNSIRLKVKGPMS